VNGFDVATTGQVFGVNGSTNSATNFAAGVNGYEGATTGQVYGVSGTTTSTGGNGVYGNSTATSGFANGVYGQTSSPSGSGVYGVNYASGLAVGVLGFVSDTTSSNWGIKGSSNSTNGVGVEGFSKGVGVRGQNLTCTRNGCSPTTGDAGQFITAAGGNLLRGFQNNAGTWTQVFFVDGSGNASFSGNVHVSGTLSKGGGSFKIDDPLDPAHKYLSHSFVESPDMKNVYDGVSVLDAHGSAWVTLPDYFEALNRDFRYQLTAIGVPEPNLYIAKKVSGNRFKIAGGKPHGEVSWQVTGIRHDAYADAYRIPVEEEKPPQEQGHYLHPELFGASEHEAIGAGMVVPSTGSASPTRASTMNLLAEDGGPVK
jgi:hypothetical protein